MGEMVYWFCHLQAPRYNSHIMQPSEARAEANTLSQPLTSFVGREQEVADIKRRLVDPACRLLTLVGPGGMGKTRLAMQVTAVVTPHFADGAFFVNLESVETADYLLSAIADALDISLTGQESPLSCIHTNLADRHILLILDNFEQVLDASLLLSQLLVGTHVKFLVTSRETLNLQEEWLYPLPGLPFPTQAPTAAEARGFGAMQLFAGRAQRARPHFSLEDERTAITRICQVVEGLPLALEMAAAWTSSMSCQEIAAEIERNRNFLVTRLRNVPSRHRSMHAIFAQTWARLNEQERNVFQRLALFRGGFLRDAAVSVADATFPLLSSLLDKSLLRWEAAEAGNGRYQIHELLRQFASAKLADHPGTAAETAAKHAQYYATFLSEQLDDLLGGRQLAVIGQIEAELNNIRAAWHWAVANDQWLIINDALEPLHLFCDMQGRHLEGATLCRLACQKLAAAVQPETRPIWGRLLSRYRFLQVFAPSSPVEMEADLQQSLTIAREQKDQLETAFALMALGGFTFYSKNDPQSAAAMFAESLPLFQARKHGFYEARVLNWLGITHPETAGLYRYCQASLEVARANNNKVDMVIASGNLAEVALTVGDYSLAEEYCDEAIATADDMRFHLVSAHTRTLLSFVYFLRGHWAGATTLIQESLVRVQELRNGMAIGYAEGIMGIYKSIAGNQQSAQQFGERSRDNQANHGLGLVAANWGLATAACELEDYEAAWKAVWQGFDQAQAASSLAMALWLLPVTAVLLQRQGRQVAAAKLLAAATSHPLSPTGWISRWSLLAETQEQLKDTRPPPATAADTLSLEQLLNEIRTATKEEPGLPAPDPVTAANQSLLEPLTPREMDVLQLIAAGLSNQQIADELVLARGTVKYYTSHIYGKLGVSSRTQAIAHARDLGLLPN